MIANNFFSDIFKGVEEKHVQMVHDTPTTVQLVKEGDISYSFNTYSTLGDRVMKFNLNEEFEDEKLDKTKIKCVTTFEGNKMIQQQKGEHAVRTERVFTDDELVVTYTADGLVAKRWYKATE